MAKGARTVAELAAVVETLRTRDARREREVRRLRHDVDALEAALMPPSVITPARYTWFDRFVDRWLRR